MTALYLGILLYLVILAFFMFYFKGFRETKSAEDFLIASGNIGFIVGFLTFSATLFSTFTLLGMPDFFKTHGVASWVFLGFTDVFMALVLLQFGLAFREQVAKVKEKTQQHIYSLSDFFLAKYNSKSLALLVALISSLFLIPYIAVQIKGVGELFYILSDQTITADTFKLFIAITIFAYTFKSGVKAVILTDTFQVILLFIVVWLIAITLTSQAGGIVTLFTSLKESGYEQHFSAPGPKGLLDYPFLISSFIVIAIMPITQPQLSSRILMFKSNKTLKYASVSIAIFSFLVILPTIVIGLFHTLNYNELNGTQALVNSLTTHISPIIIILFVAGLAGASMSTADSQVISLTGLFYHLFDIQEKNKMMLLKLLTLIFLAAAFYLSTLDFESLILLARVSFAGTAQLLPLILFALFWTKATPSALFWGSTIGISLYIIDLASKFLSFIPIPTELFTMLISALLIVIFTYILPLKDKKYA